MVRVVAPHTTHNSNRQYSVRKTKANKNVDKGRIKREIQFRKGKRPERLTMVLHTFGQGLAGQTAYQQSQLSDSGGRCGDRELGCTRGARDAVKRSGLGPHMNSHGGGGQEKKKL